MNFIEEKSGKLKNRRFKLNSILACCFLLLVCMSFKGYSQQKNFSYFKICITNEKNEILLVQYNGIWELAGKKYIDERSIKEFTGFMAEEMGVEFKDLRLRGLFNFYYNENKFPVIFNYYSAKYKSGELTIPPGCTGIKWFSLKEALKIIPIKSMTLILEKMFEKKHYTWGASMRIYTTPNSYISRVVIQEDFYPLMN